MFLGCLSVSACFRVSVQPGLNPVSTVSYTPMDRISPKFGKVRYRRTD